MLKPVSSFTTYTEEDGTINEDRKELKRREKPLNFATFRALWKISVFKKLHLTLQILHVYSTLKRSFPRSFQRGIQYMWCVCREGIWDEDFLKVLGVFAAPFLIKTCILQNHGCLIHLKKITWLKNKNNWNCFKITDVFFFISTQQNVVSGMQKQSPEVFCKKGVLKGAVSRKLVLGLMLFWEGILQHRSGSGQDFIRGAQICTPPVKSGYEIARYK